jgi:hypothetical protein
VTRADMPLISAVRLRLNSVARNRRAPARQAKSILMIADASSGSKKMDFSRRPSRP